MSACAAVPCGECGVHANAALRGQSVRFAHRVRWVRRELFLGEGGVRLHGTCTHWCGTVCSKKKLLLPGNAQQRCGDVWWGLLSGHAATHISGAAGTGRSSTRRPSGARGRRTRSSARRRSRSHTCTPAAVDGERRVLLLLCVRVGHGRTPSQTTVAPVVCCVVVLGVCGIPFRGGRRRRARRRSRRARTARSRAVPAARRCTRAA